VISKKLIQRIAVDLAVYLLKLDIEFDELELLSSENMRVEERRADLVAKVTQKNEIFILHIEIQNNNDSEMALRMLRYYTDIAFNYPNISIRQYVIYIGKAKLAMHPERQDRGLKYQYNMIDMHNIDYKKLLAQNSPDAMVLAILCDFNVDTDSVAVNTIVQLLHKRLHDNPKRFREYMYMLEVLSDNRNLKVAIKEAETVITNVKVENLPSYELGMEKGIEKGIEKGMEQGMEKVILQMLQKNTAEIVSELTGITISDIVNIKNKATTKH